MEKIFLGDTCVIKNIKCFNLALTLDCGQAFRWHLLEDGFWRGVAFGKGIKIKQEKDEIIIIGADEKEIESIWMNYFDIGRDYQTLCQKFCEDESLKEAVTAFPGIRILHQEAWEALCSFIISQNNNIPRIKGIIDRLCTNFGRPLECGEFTFPSAQNVAELSVEELSPLRAGFRAKYIIDAAQKVANGEVSINRLFQMPIDEARNELMKIKGVGAKVAECTLLYGCGRMNAFPIDVWVRRVMEELYPNGLPDCTLNNEGIAQQYLFHWRRNTVNVNLSPKG